MKQLFLYSRDLLNIELFNDTYQIRDYTNNISIQSIIDKYKDNLLVRQINEDERIDLISYKIYGTTDFWDLLMILNNIKKHNELPVNYDKVVKRASNKHNEWLKIFGKYKSSEDIQLKYQEFLDKEIQHNEKFRYLKYINPVLLSQIQLDLKNLKKKVERENIEL